MTCPGCGSEVADEAKFCSECGSKLWATCPGCQAPVKADQKFCAQCGTALDQASPPAPSPRPAPATPPSAQPAQPAGDRRVVTVLFTDVSGFTAMSEKLDPEQVTEIVNNFFQVLVEPIYRYGGVVDKYIGDAIMALFGAPVAHEDDPVRAVRAAWEMQLAAQRHAAELEAQTGIGLKVRIGINTGLVVAGAVGGSQRADYTVMGDTVNLAQRMEANARPGKVLVTGETWALTRSAFDFTALEPITVKGKTQLVPVYELMGTRASTEALGDEVLVVGRELELGQLEGTARLAGQGRPQWVQLVGEMGLGKSALIRRFLQGLKPEARIVWGRALSYDQQVYQVPAALLRSCLGLPDHPPPSEILENLARLVATHLPENPDRSVALLAHLLALDVRHPEVESLSPQQRRSAAFLTLNEFLVAASARTLQILSLEDLHWADEGSIEWLCSLAERLAQSTDRRILVLCQSRPEGAFLSMALDDRLAQSWILLRPLPLEESMALLAALLGATPEGLPAPVHAVLDQALARAEGNPFYLAELLRTFQESGILVRRGATWTAELPGGDFKLPSNVQGAIASRLDRLEPDLKRMLQVAAVIGRTFEPAILERVVGADPRRILDRLADAGFLYMRSTGEVAFTQAIIQEVAYQNLLLAARRDLHGRVGQFLEEAAGPDPGPVARILAFHFVRAEIADKACRYLALSADRARSSHAVAESLASYRQALDLHRRIEGRVADVDLAAILAGLAAVEITAGDLSGALEHLEEALSASRSPKTTADCHRLILKALIRKGDDREAKARCTGWLAELEAAGSDGPDARTQRAVLLTTLAELHLHLGEFDAAQGSCHRALDLLTGTDQSAALAGVYNVLGMGAYLRRNFAEASEHYQRAVSLRESLQDLPGLSDGFNNLALAHAGQGQWAIAAEAYDKALKIVSRIGDVARVATLQINRGALLLSMGRVEEAERAFEIGHEIYTRMGNPIGEASASSFLGQTAIATGRPADAVARLSRSLALLEQVGARGYAAEVLRCLGHAELLAGDPDKARQTLNQGLLVATEAGNEQEIAILGSLLAELQAMEDDLAGASDRVKDAITRLRNVGDPLELGRALLRSARILRRAGDPRSATAAAEEAADLFSKLGASLDLAAARALAHVS